MSMSVLHLIFLNFDVESQVEIIRKREKTMDFFESDFDHREAIPVKMGFWDWKTYCETRIEEGESKTRVSGTYSVLLLKNSAIPLELMSQGYGIETAMCQAHNVVSSILRAFTGLSWYKLHQRLDVKMNALLDVLSLPTLNLLMQGAVEMLTVLREEQVCLFKMEERAYNIGVSLRDQVGYNPFKNPEIYHHAYQTNRWEK